MTIRACAHLFMHIPQALEEAERLRSYINSLTAHVESMRTVQTALLLKRADLSRSSQGWGARKVRDHGRGSSLVAGKKTSSASPGKVRGETAPFQGWESSLTEVC